MRAVRILITFIITVAMATYPSVPSIAADEGPGFDSEVGNINNAAGTSYTSDYDSGDRDNDSMCGAYKDTRNKDFLIGLVSLVAAALIARQFCPPVARALDRLTGVVRPTAPFGPMPDGSNLQPPPGPQFPGFGVFVCMAIVLPLTAKGIEALITGLRRKPEIDKCEKKKAPGGDGVSVGGSPPPVLPLPSPDGTLSTAEFGGGAGLETMPLELPLNLGTFPPIAELNGTFGDLSGGPVDVNDPGSVEKAVSSARAKANASSGGGAAAAEAAMANSLANDSSLKAFREATKKEIEKKYGKGSSDTSGFEGGGRGFGGNGDGDGSGTGAANFGSGSAPRAPASTKGLSKVLNDGTSVGLGKDNIFEMVTRRYNTINSRGQFLPANGGGGRQPARARRF